MKTVNTPFGPKPARELPKMEVDPERIKTTRAIIKAIAKGQLKKEFGLK